MKVLIAIVSSLLGLVMFISTAAATLICIVLLIILAPIFIAIKAIKDERKHQPAPKTVHRYLERPEGVCRKVKIEIYQNHN